MHIRNKKTLVLIALVMMTGQLLKAQTENTHERLSTQLKNGTAPGLLFATTQPAGSNSAQQQKEGLITQIRKGIAPGMKFQAGSGAPAARTARPAGPVATTTPQASVVKQGPLASELEIQKAPPATTAKPIIPSQEEAAPAPAEKQ